MQYLRYRRRIRSGIVGLSVLLAVMLLAACAGDGPPMIVDKSKSYKAVVKTTKGEFTIQLLAKDAPITVNNFVTLSRDKFYDGLKFHRIARDFVIQTGDPDGTGRGGPGYMFKDEKTPYKYETGIVAMANTGKKNTNGSQFFICSGDECSILNQQPIYTIFGKVVDGMDIIDKINETPVAFNVNTQDFDLPTEDVLIESIEIIEE